MIRTTAADIETPPRGVILPHEHIHTDLLPIARGGDRMASEQALVEAVAGKLRRAAAAGLALVVECTPPYVGQNVAAVHRVCAAAGVPVVVATGLYKQDFWPEWALEASVSKLSDWMVAHIEQGFDGTGLRAGFIKLAVTDAGVTGAEDKALAAAVRAAESCGATIACHSPVGANALHQLEMLSRLGGDPGRYIQVHAHIEADFGQHLEVLRRGAWVEYDGIGGGPSDGGFVDLIRRVFDAGFGRRLLLSQDVCGYLVDREPHSDEREYAYLAESFIPKLRGAGFSEGEIDQLVRANPAAAFALRMR